MLREGRDLPLLIVRSPTDPFISWLGVHFKVMASAVWCRDRYPGTASMSSLCRERRTQAPGRECQSHSGHKPWPMGLAGTQPESTHTRLAHSSKAMSAGKTLTSTPGGCMPKQSLLQPTTRIGFGSTGSSCESPPLPRALMQRGMVFRTRNGALPFQQYLFQNRRHLSAITVASLKEKEAQLSSMSHPTDVTQKPLPRYRLHAPRPAAPSLRLPNSSAELCTCSTLSQVGCGGGLQDSHVTALLPADPPPKHVETDNQHLLSTKGVLSLALLHQYHLNHIATPGDASLPYFIDSKAHNCFFTF